MTDIICGTDKLKLLVAKPAQPQADELAVIADRIRGRIRRTTADIIATGNDLLTVKAKLEHGEFITWIDREFQMTDRTARNYMQAAEWALGKSETVSVLPPATVYKLSSPSTPETIKAEVIADLEAGRPVDHRAVEERIRMNRRIDRQHEHNLGRARYRRAVKSPAAQKRREAQARKAAIQVAEREKACAAAEAEAMTIFAKLEPADLQRLRELLAEFGPYVIVQRLKPGWP
jgi:hypothetical protein